MMLVTGVHRVIAGVADHGLPTVHALRTSALQVGEEGQAGLPALIAAPALRFMRVPDGSGVRCGLGHGGIPRTPRIRSSAVRAMMRILLMRMMMMRMLPLRLEAGRGRVHSLGGGEGIVRF